MCQWSPSAVTIGLLVKSDESQFPCPQGSLGPIERLKLSKNLAHVVLNGAFGDVQVLPDLLVAHAARETSQDI